MRAQAVLISILCLGSFVSAQQNSPIQRIKAVVQGPVPATHNASHTLLTENAMCDNAGNIYTRPFDAEKSFGLESPITRSAPGAVSTGSFSVAELPGGISRTYFVNQGKVYVPAGSGGNLEVIAFAPAGTISSRTKLDVNGFLDVWHLGVFNSGEYLLVGTTGKLTGTSTHLTTPVTAVFAADGRLLKTIEEPEDEQARQKAEEGNADFLPCCADSGNFFVRNADIAAGSDGNLYLLHGGPAALVYAISPAGNVLRKFRVLGGNPETRARNIRSYDDKLAVEFQRAKDSDLNLISVVDFAGNPVAKYEIQDDTTDSGLILACYGPSGFTLVPAWTGDKPFFLTARLP